MNGSCVLGRRKALKPAFLGAVVTAIVGLSAPAMADEQPVTRSKTVSLADLDLSTPEGVGAARERVHQVARQLCSRLADRDDLSRQQNFVACIDASMAAVTPRVLELAQRKSSNNLARNRDH